MNVYLAVDIGASSGRHIAGWLENGIMHTQEVYRFPNGAAMKDGHLCWDMEALTGHVIAGIKAAREQGFAPTAMAIDTWAVDFVLLDNNRYYSFFNPKGGLSFNLSPRSTLYASVAVSHREPSRSDIKESIKSGEEGKLKSERLIDYELGYRYASDKLSLMANLYFMIHRQCHSCVCGGLGDSFTRLLTNFTQPAAKNFQSAVFIIGQAAFNFALPLPGHIV